MMSFREAFVLALRLRRIEPHLLPPCVPKELFSQLMEQEWDLAQDAPAAFSAARRISLLPSTRQHYAYWRYLDVCQDVIDHYEQRAWMDQSENERRERLRGVENV